MRHILLHIVQFGLDLVKGVEKPFGRYHGAEAQAAGHVPEKHMPPRGVRAFDTHCCGFRFQLLRDPRHLYERVDEQRRDPEKIRLPIRADLVACNFLKLALQPAERHIEQEEQPRGKKPIKPSQKPFRFV